MALLLRLSAALALGTVAAVHLALSGRYDLVGDQITLGQLFRVQATVTAALAVALLVHAGRAVALAAAAGGALSLSAVVGTAYLAVPALGPLPPVYEPIWYPDKVVAAAAAAVATAAALALSRRRAAP